MGQPKNAPHHVMREMGGAGSTAIHVDLDDNANILFGDIDDVVAGWDGTNLNFIPVADDTGAFNIGNGTRDMDLKVFLGDTSNYALFDVGNNKVSLASTLTSQTTEKNMLGIAYTTDSTYITGTNMTYSGARGSAALNITSTYSGISGGFSNIVSFITKSGATSAAGNGVVGIKQVVTNTAAMSAGVVYGAQFIAKHAHATNIMTASASLIGLEAWTYNSAAGPARTQIGGNFGWHNEATGGTYGAGSVIRGIQIFCDNNAGGNDPVESSGLCIWNMAGTITNAINVVQSGSGFTNLFSFAAASAPVVASSSGDGTHSYSLTCNVGSTAYYIRLHAV